MGTMVVTVQQGRRKQLADASDPRVARTRQRVITACRELLGSNQPVTVSAICARAGVGRSTFYTHFATIGDIAVTAVDRLFDELTATDIKRRTASALHRAAIVRISLDDLLRAVLEEREFFLYALSAPAAERVRERFVSAVATTLQNTARAERPNASAAFHRTAADFTANGIVGVLLGWVASPSGRSQAEMIDILSELLPSWLSEEPRSESSSVS